MVPSDRQKRGCRNKGLGRGGTTHLQAQGPHGRADFRNRTTWPGTEYRVSEHLGLNGLHTLVTVERSSEHNF